MRETAYPGPKPELIHHLLAPFLRFARIEAASGLVLMAMAAIAVVWANTDPAGYEAVWETRLGFQVGGFGLAKPALLWINDGLMAVFFFVVGLEIKREVMVGELNSLRQALLPVAAAIGGTLFPALLFTALNLTEPTSGGWGIPMATDIAFALGILSLLGKRAPVQLKIFLTAVAVVDDIAAVLVIALFYTSSIATTYLMLAGGVLALLVIMNLAGVRYPSAYFCISLVMWFLFLKSGIHATVAGVLAAMAIPARARCLPSQFLGRARAALDSFQKCAEDDPCPLANKGQLAALEELDIASRNASTPLMRIEHGLHPWVAFAIMPLFALANAGVTIPDQGLAALASPLSLGIILGLILGKQIGILLPVWLLVKLKAAPLPEGMGLRHVYGASWLGAIGFTMSIFIATLAFDPAGPYVASAKLAILAASLLAGAVGYLLLRTMKPEPA